MIAFATYVFLYDKTNCPISLLPLNENVVSDAVVIQLALSLKNQSKMFSRRKYQLFRFIILRFMVLGSLMKEKLIQRLQRVTTEMLREGRRD